MKTALLSTLLLTATSSAVASTCSRGDIDHYLKSGFTHQQIVALCGEKQTTPKRQNSSTPNAITTSQASNTNSEESIYFKSAIEGSKVDVLGDKLIFVAKECMKFGLEDMTGEKEKVCRDVKTTVSYQGLELLKAQKGIFLIQDPMLLMGGTFSRELTKPESIIPRHKKEFFEDFQTNPKTINIPVRKGFDPQEVGQRLIQKG